MSDAPIPLFDAKFEMSHVFYNAIKIKNYIGTIAHQFPLCIIYRIAL